MINSKKLVWGFLIGLVGGKMVTNLEYIEMVYKEVGMCYVTSIEMNIFYQVGW